MTFPSIAIVGGGLGGLVLARVLQNNGIPCTVYELDSTPDARNQGGMLDMHEESGQRAMREAGLYEEFLRIARPEAEAMRVLDEHGTVILDEAAEDSTQQRPEVDRAALRDILVDSLEPGRIAWGHKVSSVSGRELTFANGDTVTADVVIGADGTWSKVRPLVSSAKPEYSGISFLELRLPDADTRYPAAAALVGEGSMFALSDGKGLFCQRNGDGQIRVYAALRVPEDWLDTCGVNWSDAVAARTELLQWFDDWSTELTELIRDCADTIIPRPIYALPIGHSWERVPGVTLLGDAAHVMSPFAGEGANLAMLDGAELGLAIARHGTDFEAALAEYEATMFPRAKESAEGSALGLELCLGSDAPHGLVAEMTSH